MGLFSGVTKQFDRAVGTNLSGQNGGASLLGIRGDIGRATGNLMASKEGKALARFAGGNYLGGTGGSVDWGRTAAIIGDKSDRANADYDARVRATEAFAGGGAGAMPGLDNNYEKLALDLTNRQKMADTQELQSTGAAQLAGQRSNLAMRGGLTAGANERLAADSQNNFANAYSQLATQYGIGGAQIRKEGYDKQQDLALQREMGADRMRAQDQANSGGLFGGKIIKGWL